MDGKPKEFHLNGSVFFFLGVLYYDRCKVSTLSSTLIFAFPKKPRHDAKRCQQTTKERPLRQPFGRDKRQVNGIARYIMYVCICICIYIYYIYYIHIYNIFDSYKHNFLYWSIFISREPKFLDKLFVVGIVSIVETELWESNILFSPSHTGISRRLRTVMNEAVKLPKPQEKNISWTGVLTCCHVVWFRYSLLACFLFPCENQASYETWRFPEFSNFVTSPTNPTGVVFGSETGVNIHDIYPRSVTNPDLAGAIGPPEKGQHLVRHFWNKGHWLWIATWIIEKPEIWESLC